MSVSVVPDSGTGALIGIRGKMDVIIEGRKHSYVFEFVRFRLGERSVVCGTAAASRGDPRSAKPCPEDVLVAIGTSALPSARRPQRSPRQGKASPTFAQELEQKQCVAARLGKAEGANGQFRRASLSIPAALPFAGHPVRLRRPPRLAWDNSPPRGGYQWADRASPEVVVCALISGARQTAAGMATNVNLAR